MDSDDRFKVQKETICLHIHRVHIRFTLCQACSYNIKGVDGGEGGGVGYLLNLFIENISFIGCDCVTLILSLVFLAGGPELRPLKLSVADF